MSGSAPLMHAASARPARRTSRHAGSPMARGRGRSSLIAVFLLLPFLAYSVLVLSPLAQAVGYSLTAWTGFSDTLPFVGLDNYLALVDDELFLTAIRNNLFILLVLPLITLTLAFALASAVTFGGRSVGWVSGIRGGRFYSSVAFFPFVLPAVVVALIWNQAYDPNNGLVNGLLRAVGLGALAQVWLGDPAWAMAASLFVMIWGLVGFYSIIFVAAIRAIPTELFEAARLDGAGRFRTAVAIVLPGILSQLHGAYLYIGIAALDAFLPMALLNPAGGPDFTTLVMTQQIYDAAFFRARFGLACAMGVVMATLTFAFVGLLGLIGRAIKRWYA